MFQYTVSCQFQAVAQDVAAAWLEWLRDRHLDEVIQCGALSATLVQLDGQPLTFEIHYQFANRKSFDEYVAEHAPRLRAEGLSLFPLEKGLAYQRRTGEVIAVHPGDAGESTGRQ